MKLRLEVEIPENLEKLETEQLKNFITSFLGFWKIEVIKIKREKEQTLCKQIRKDMKWNYETGKYEFSKELGEQLILK